MKRQIPAGSAPGFTVVEMLISTTILVVLMAMSLTLLRASTTEMEVEMTAATLEAEARRALELMTEEIRQSRMAVVGPQVPPSPGWATVLVFQEATGILSMAPAFSSSITYAYRWNPGTAWGEVTRTQDGATTVLVARLQQNGFRLERDPLHLNNVTVRLVLESPGFDGRPLVRDVQTSVMPRN